MKKEDLSKWAKNAGDVKDKATKLAQDAKKHAGTVKQAVSTGITTSKAVLGKAGEVLNKKTVSQGLDVGSKGAEIVAKGARIAAETIEKASEGMKKMSDKLKK